jgi:hypothetical protein
MTALAAAISPRPERKPAAVTTNAAASVVASMSAR